MNRTILAKVIGPTVIIGVMLFAACLVSAWYVSRVRSDIDNALTDYRSNLRVAHQLQTHLRELHFHSFLFMVEPSEAVLQQVRKDEARFEEWLAKAHASEKTPKEQTAVRAIRTGFQTYQGDLELLRREAEKKGPRKELHKLVLDHPIRHIIDHYAQLNEELIVRASQESERAGQWAQLTLLLLGVAGPLGGLLSGYGIARGLSRSLFRLSVRVQDMAQHLETDVGALKLQPDAGLEQLDQQLDHVVERLVEVVNEMHRQQAEVLRAQQLSAVGQLAASVAHEVRNPLTSIKMLVEAGLGISKPRPFTRENLQVIHTEILRLEQTVQSFLNFARPPALHVGCDLRTVIGRSVELVGTRARQQQVIIEWHPAAARVHAVVDESQLTNVLVNLLLNALDAMPAGGKILLDLHEEAGHELRLCVRDTGTGIRPDMLDKLFVPFHSSKATGSGLGLSICKRIMQEHGGSILAANDPAGGACFTLLLPNGQEAGGRNQQAQVGDQT